MKVLFVSSPGKKFDIVPFIESQAISLQNNGILVDHYLIGGKGLRGYLSEIPKLRKNLSGKKYDIIHAHYVFAGWVAYISSPKACNIVSFMGSDVYGVVNSQGRRIPRGYIDIVASRLLQPFVDKIIVKSNNLKDYVYLKNKASVIPNGVDYERFKPRDKKEARKNLKLPLDKRLVLFLGDPNSPRKNIALLKNALKRIHHKQINLVAPFPVEQEKIAQYYNACDVLVLASYLEGSPNVIKEGMASNIPIVSTKVGDVQEVVGNTDGCFVCTYDAMDMSQKILNALSYNEGTNGREDIRSLEINVIAKRIIEIYNDLLSY